MPGLRSCGKRETAEVRIATRQLARSDDVATRTKQYLMILNLKFITPPRTLKTVPLFRGADGAAGAAPPILCRRVERRALLEEAARHPVEAAQL